MSLWFKASTRSGSHALCGQVCYFLRDFATRHRMIRCDWGRDLVHSLPIRRKPSASPSPLPSFRLFFSTFCPQCETAIDALIPAPARGPLSKAPSPPFFARALSACRGTRLRRLPARPRHASSFPGCLIQICTGKIRRPFMLCEAFMRVAIPFPTSSSPDTNVPFYPGLTGCHCRDHAIPAPLGTYVKILISF